MAPTTEDNKLDLFSIISGLNFKYGALYLIRNAKIVRKTIPVQLKNAQHFAPRHRNIKFK